MLISDCAYGMSIPKYRAFLSARYYMVCVFVFLMLHVVFWRSAASLLGTPTQRGVSWQAKAKTNTW